jgi:hypothetical protein
MASQPIVQPNKHPQPQGSPYCSDPNCQSCKELRATHEAIRLHEPLPRPLTPAPKLLRPFDSGCCLLNKLISLLPRFRARIYRESHAWRIGDLSQAFSR